VPVADLSDVLTGDPWQWPQLTDGQFAALMPSGNDSEFIKRRFFQYIAVQHCNTVLKVEIEKSGSGFAVLAAVRKCGECGLPLPDWLVTEFNKRYDPVLNFRVKSWDAPESFGKPYPKGTNIAAQRKKRNLQVDVWNEVMRILKMEPDTPIDGGLFERVGGPLNIRATLAAEYYYSVKKKLGGRFVPHDSGVSMYVDGFDMTAPKNSANFAKTAGLRKRRK
jgi:hypothetical protein